MTEEWRAIPGYEGVYEASSLGRVKRVRSGRILATAEDGKGYLLTHLCKGGVRWLTQTHRLIAMAFIRADLAGVTVNHLNGVKGDNRIENLEVISHRGNIHHAIATGFRNLTGQRNGNAILGEEDVAAVRAMIATGRSSREIARLYSVSKSCIDKIRIGRTWKHL